MAQQSFVPTGKAKWRKDPLAARTAFKWCYWRSLAMRRRMMEMDKEWRRKNGLPPGRFPKPITAPMESVHRDFFWVMQFFYASVYPLVEAWREIGYRDDRVEELLRETDRVDRIRCLRNAVWHFNTHDDPRLESYQGDREQQEFVTALHQAFGEFAVRLADSPESELTT